LGYADAAGNWPEARWLAASAASARVVARFNSLLSVMAATGAGMGLGLMPCSMGETGPGLRRVVPPPSTLRRDIWLVVHRDMQQNARVRAVLHFIDELIQRERPLMAGEGLASSVLPAAPTPAPKRPAAGGRKTSRRAS
jgi:DNA-binding transcriptional LysR family regulator